MFSLLEPRVFETCFANWIASLHIDLKREIIAVDGKTLRGSGNKTQGESAIHMVSAWAATSRMLLAQVKTAEKSNEITAIPQLLKMLDVKEATVTIDAMGCQTAIAKQIVSQGADYVLSLKENQPSLYENVRSIFALAEGGEKKYKKSRIGHSAQNLGLIRRIVLNLLKQEKTHKRGITCRRKSAGWDHQYLLKVLGSDQHFKTN